MRPRRRAAMTAEDLAALVRDYCAAYGVTPNAEGFVPFPAGQRETPQHRDWIRLYKARQRLEQDAAQARLKLG